MPDLVISDKEKIKSLLIIRLDRLEGRIIELERENIFLKGPRDRLAKYWNPKNSRNSSTPPCLELTGLSGRILLPFNHSFIKVGIFENLMARTVSTSLCDNKNISD